MTEPEHDPYHSYDSPYVEAEGRVESGREDLLPSIKVPEPVHRKGRSMRQTPIDEGQELGVASAIWTWIVQHRLETAVFLVTVSLLSVAAMFLSVDPGPRGATPVVTVGPLPGQDLEAYVETRRRALEDVAGGQNTRVAVVTFATALTSQQVEVLAFPPAVSLAEVIVGDAFGYPETVEGGGRAAVAVEEWRQRRLDILEAQQRGLSAVLAASPSPSPAGEWYKREADSVERAITKVRAGTVVLGAIVSGREQGLVELQKNPEVLLVDLAPSGVSSDRVSYRLALR